MISYLCPLRNGFTLYEESNFQTDLNLIEEIRCLIAPSYNDVTTLLERELTHNKLIYFTRDRHGNLASFFMTNFDTIDNTVISYMGLLAVSERHRCSELTVPVIIRYIQNLKQKERELQQQIFSWATTATICSYKCLTSFCDEYHPKEDGSFTTEGKEMAARIARHFKLSHDKDTPFILKGIAKGTIYSKVEKERIMNIIRHKKFKLFEKFRIEEDYGDRILLIGFGLSNEKYNKWMSKIDANAAIV